MDKRLKDINLLLSEFSVGRFNKRLALSKDLDEVDAIINGINMLGDELKSITISRDYFNNIFNSVSDMVFILNKNGIIQDANKSAQQQLRYGNDSLIGKTINELQKGNASYFKKVLYQLGINEVVPSYNGSLYTHDGVTIPVNINVSYFKDEQKRQLILFTASDITFRIKTENLIIRAIIDTQEEERQRLAKDLHDGLAQQLSAIKFYISSTADNVKNREQKKLLLKSNDALTEVMSDMRNICFSLMPKTLEEFGLVKAVKEFCNHFLAHTKAIFNIQQKGNLPNFSAALKIDLYRVVQEFINNAIKHGHATEISISFNYQKKILKLLLADNGKGFDSSLPEKGMGLQNARSRVKSHHGELIINSNIGKGTCYKITIPLNI